jgi:hypothetical protein
MKKKYQRNGMSNALNIQYQASENDVKLKRKRYKPLFMEKYNLSYKDIAEAFGYSSPNSFYNAHARQDIIDGIEWIVKTIEKKNEGL